MTVRSSLFSSLLIVVLAWTPASCQRYFGHVEADDSGGPLTSEQAAYDVKFYDLALSIFPETKSIVGTLRADVEVVAPLGTLVLDLDSTFSVDHVVVHDEASGDSSLRSFDHDDGQLSIDLGGEVEAGTRLSAQIHYGGQPRVAPRPPWIGGFTWSQTSDGDPWIGVSCQMDGADIWWPCKDHPSDKPDSMALHFRVDTSLVVAANGRLESVEDHGDGTHTWHWFVSTPISNYTVSLNVGPYEEIDGTYESVTGEKVPYSFWVLPERLEDGHRQYGQFSKELRFLEETLGPYPFRADKYGVAHTPYLGMEHQSIIAYGSSFKNNSYGFDWLHFHELAHEWWANLVTAADWKDFWIHEGFATYMEALYAEELNDEAAYHAYVSNLRRRIFNQKPVAPTEPRSAAQMYFTEGRRSSDNDVYFKGAVVLHMLRYLLGEETLRLALRRMAYPEPELEQVTDGTHVRLVDTEDFIELVESLSGDELDWFFDVYLRQPKLPELVVLREANRLDLKWNTPDDLPVPMPVDVRIGDRLTRVAMDEGSVSMEIAEDAEVEIDPLDWILKAECHARVDLTPSQCVHSCG
jgi:aminopeptidase N